MPQITTPYGSWDLPGDLVGESGRAFTTIDTVNGVDIMRLYAPAAAYTFMAQDIVQNASASWAGTSATEATIALGAKTLVTETSKGFAPNMRIVAWKTGSFNTAMFGVVTDYDPITGTLSFDCQDISGSGTFTDWTISVGGGRPGPQGSEWLVGSGAPADVLGTDNDLYLDDQTGAVYRKAAGSWGAAVANIRGDIGPAGAGATIHAKDAAGTVVTAEARPAIKAGPGVVFSDDGQNIVAAVDVGTGANQIVQLDGTGALPAGLAAGGFSVTKTVFTTSGSWVKPPDCEMHYVQVWAGGGGGADNGGGGGGGGGYAEAWFADDEFAATEPVIIGAGGSHGVPASNGGASHFAEQLYAFGGKGGIPEAGGLGGESLQQWWLQQMQSSFRYA